MALHATPSMVCETDKLPKSHEECGDITGRPSPVDVTFKTTSTAAFDSEAVTVPEQDNHVTYICFFIVNELDGMFSAIPDSDRTGPDSALKEELDLENENPLSLMPSTEYRKLVPAAEKPPLISGTPIEFNCWLK